VISNVDSKNFEQEVVKSKLPVVVDFWATWCGPCRLFSPIIDAVSEEYSGKVKFVKVNTDENEKIAAEYNIMGIPAVLIFDGGIVKTMSVGALSKADFKKWLESNL